MWPMLVDYSVEDCKKELRSCELVAYSAIISAFRAQGSLTKEKRKILQDLSSILSISLERHRAEIRRAINDEHLNTIAEKLSGSNTTTEWAIEGRRVVPLMQRHAPQTVFTEIANSVASAQAAKNASLLHPGKTGLREATNGTEVMASRKRKDFPPSDYASVSPSKMTVMEGQYFSNLYYAENSNPVVSEPSPVPESYDNISVPEAASPMSPILLPDFNAPKNAASPTSLASLSLPTKSISKKPKKLFKSECESLQHPMQKTSTVTTFSSFDPMSTNVISSKVTSQNPSSVCQGDHISVSTFSEHIKAPPDQKSPRPISSVGSMKSSTVVIPTSSTCTTSPSSRGHLPTASSSSSQHNKFMSPIRSKSPNYTRPNLPAGLGIKLGSQTQVTQRATVPQKSLGMKMKSESPSFFPKKSTPTAFGSDNQTSQFQLPSSNDSLTITKSPISITKTTSKSEPQTILPPQTSTKPTTQASKTVAKSTTAQNSQYISRSLFSTANKGGATKTLAPVIFNVGSTSSPTLPTSTKTTGSVQSEVGKPSPQLLPKTTGVGVSPSHLKINTSTTQTIQYRNDGGLVRSARILNISQPVGSRLPCAISPSAISALGLPTNISSTALRVTLPPGTLNTTSSIRVSAAAKPNVIVVHKAQMWPRNQQPGAAVIMGSSTLTKLPSDIKPEKSRPVMSKTPRAIAPARAQSQAASSSHKTSEATMNSGSSIIPRASSPVTSIVPLSENSTSESQNSQRVPEAIIDVQCKRNLLADVMEASGILYDKISPKKPSIKEKNDHGKNSKDLCNNQEAEAKFSQRNLVSSSSLDANSLNLDAKTTKNEESACETGDVTLHLMSPIERNGIDESLLETRAQAAEAQTKEPVEVSSAHVSSDYFKSSGCSKVQNDVVKEKDS